MKRLSKSMVVCFMAAVMIMTVGCQKEDIAPIIPDSPIVPDGVLPGLFSVSATRQVRFSQGNLQYQASTNTWRFAEHQYDYVGSDNRSISSTYSGWIDLFGWGTGSNPTLSSSYPEDYGTFVDWGSNAIINGGNTTNLWRTLTSAEWEYLLNTRPGASSKLGSGNINGVGGLIILPDSWTQPSECSFASGFAIINPYHYPDWKHNSYTLAQWAQMEAAGAVFLPAAGRRKGTDFDNVGFHGYYWSSTPYSKNDAYHMYFSSYNLIASINCSRSYGYPIRPVLDN
jgi:uncharacterized protein (TIGR02145 family)